MKESKTKREREREREREYVQNSKEKDGVVRESKRIGRRCENEGEREREREGKSSLVSLVHERVTLVVPLEGKRQRGREEVKETVGGRKRE